MAKPNGGAEPDDRGVGGVNARKNRVVVVTGASAGVGRACAIRFAREGYRVGLIARGRAGLEGARREVEAAGGTALGLPCDVSDAAQVEAAAARVEQELGPIDVWVNNAMATVFSRFAEIEPEEFRRVTEVSYLGYVYGTRAALRRMAARNRGTIVQVGSALAYRGIPLQSAYCGAKHAIQGFTEALRCELLHDRSKVWLTMVQLPAVNTPQFGWSRNKMPHAARPIAPIFQPELVADAVYFAAQHRRRELYVGGSTVIAIVGNKLAPGLGDRYLARSAFAGQQRDEPNDRERPDNLFAAVDQDRDYGTHGSFDPRARSHSLLTTVARHKWAGLVASAALLSAGVRWYTRR